MKALLEKEGVGRCVVLGHSMGGMVATRFALMYSESTERLILLNPIGLEDSILKAPYVSVDQWYEQELKKTAEGIKKYQLSSYYFGERDEKYDPWIYLLAAPLGSPDYPRLAWKAALTYDVIFTQPVASAISPTSKTSRLFARRSSLEGLETEAQRTLSPVSTSNDGGVGGHSPANSDPVHGSQAGLGTGLATGLVKVLAGQMTVL